MSDSDIKDHLNRIEEKVDKIAEVVHQHVGFVSAAKSLLAGFGATFALVLAYLGFKAGK